MMHPLDSSHSLALPQSGWLIVFTNILGFVPQDRENSFRSARFEETRFTQGSLAFPTTIDYLQGMLTCSCDARHCQIAISLVWSILVNRFCAKREHHESF